MSEFRLIQTRHILVVEDDPMTARMLAEAFATESAKRGIVACFLISITGWGEAAIEWMASGVFDGYIVDGNLKGRTHGIDVINRIRESDEASPLVLHCSGAGSMRAIAILHHLHNIEKTRGSADTAARYIIDKLFPPAN